MICGFSGGEGVEGNKSQWNDTFRQIQSFMFGTCDKFEQSDVWINKFRTITNSVTDPNWYYWRHVSACNFAI